MWSVFFVLGVGALLPWNFYVNAKQVDRHNIHRFMANNLYCLSVTICLTFRN